MLRSASMDICMITLQSRLLMGLTYGLTYLTVTVHTSDIASRPMRKKVTLLVVVLNAIGITAYALYARLEYPEWNIVGYFLMYTGGSALVSTPFFCLEPPTYYLLHKNESKALRHFTILNNERKPSRRTSKKFAELELMVKEDIQNGDNILSGGNFRPLGIVLLGKLLSLATSNVPLILIMCRWAWRIQPPGESNFTVIMVIQTVLGFLALIFSQCGGPRFIYVFTILLSSILLFFGIFPFSFHFAFIPDYIFQLITLIGLSTLALAANYYQLLHSMEAFTITKKAWSIALLSIIEHSIHFALLFLYVTTVMSRSSYIVGGFIGTFTVSTLVVLFISSALLFAMVPSKIKGLSVRGIRSRFNKHLERKLCRTEKSA